ncbi:MAG: glycosyltransferase family 39 protein [Anaerolineae bacterium]|nr:glycosyltransferase family 39 protein [Anaerolineae bacterium]
MSLIRQEGGTVGTPATAAILGRWLWLLPILLLAFWLRLFLLDGQSLWWDEGISLHLATSSLAEIVANRVVNIHPPLYFFLLKLWVALTGTTVFAARYSSVLGSFLQLALVYAVLRRWFGRSSATIGLVVTAVWSLSIVYGQELRAYAFLPLVYLLLLWLAWEIGLGTPTRRRWLALGVVEWVTLHLHYNALFLLLFVNLWLLFKLWRGPHLGTWLKVQVVAGLASLPWAVGVLLNWSAVQAEASLAGSVTEPPAWEFVLPQVWGFHLTGLVNVIDKPGVRPLALIFFILLIVLLLWPWLARRQAKASTGTLLLFWLGPLALGFSVWLVRSYSHPRYIALFAAGFVLLLAVLLTPTHWSGRWLWLGNWLRGGTAVCFLWLSGWGLQHYFFDPAYAKDDLRSVAAAVAEMTTPDDLILLPYAGYAFQFEYGGDTPIVLPAQVRPDTLWPDLADWSGQPRRLLRVMDQSDVTAAAGLLPFALESGGWLVQQLDFDGIQVAVYQLDAEIRPPDFQPAAAQFGSLRLTGVWLEQAAAADTAVTLALTWQKTEAIERPINAALRLVDSDGLPLAQQNEPLVDALNRPTTLWAAGETVITYHRLPLAPGTPPLTFAVDLSLYTETEAGITAVERVDVAGQQVVLGQVSLSPPVGVANPYELADSLPPLLMPTTFGDGLTLLAAGVDRQEIAPGQSLLVVLKWQAEQGDLPAIEPRVALVQGDDVLVESVGAPALGRYPTQLWQAGEVVVEHRFLAIPAAAEGPAQLVVAVEDEVTAVTNLTISTTARQFTQPPVDVVVNEAVGDSAVLLGYSLPQTEFAAADALPLTLVWQAGEVPFGSSYTVFVHLLDEAGNLIGQHDGLPVNGSRPTTSWLPGEFLVDVHEVRLRDPSFSGRANLVVGLYDPVSGTRLVAQNGRDFIPLDSELVITANE